MLNSPKWLHIDLKSHNDPQQWGFTAFYRKEVIKMKAPIETSKQIKKVIEAWADLAPDKSFGAMTLEQFKTRVKPSLDTRDMLLTVKNARIDAQTTRLQSDADSLLAVSQVVSGVKADPTEGEDSALYEACGYVPKSKRKSGLSRKAKTAVTQGQIS
ncbi:MAG: hypothetical protein ABIR29_03755 [Chthoniobacterales bacterium]